MLTGADKQKIYLSKLFNQLDCWFPNDVGCFCIYFLNYIQLSPGQAIYLGANEPHAYICGGHTSLNLYYYFFNIYY